MKSLIEFIQEAKNSLNKYEKITQIIFKVAGLLNDKDTKQFEAVDTIVKKQKLTTIEAYANPEFKSYLTSDMKKSSYVREYLKFNNAFDNYIKEYDTEAKNTIKQIYKDNSFEINWGWHNDTTFVSVICKPDEDEGLFPILFVCH